MNSTVPLSDLSAGHTLHYLSHRVSLSGDVVAKLQAQEVDGRFLKEQFAQGRLRSTLTSHPFNIPFGVASTIESWVEESIRGGEEYVVETQKPKILDPQIFGSLMVRLGDELSKDSRIRILNRLTGKPAVAENYGESVTNFWAFLHARGLFSRENPNPNVFEGYPVVQRIIREVCSLAPQTVNLDDLISESSVWSVIGQRLPQIQFELDTQLRKSGKPESIAWFHHVTLSPGGPRVQTKVLFTEAQQQMCLNELMRAVAKVSPLIGQHLSQVPVQEKMNLPERVPTMKANNVFVESMAIQQQTKTMLASTLLSQHTDVPLEKLVTQLMLDLGRDNAWLKYAEYKGAINIPSVGQTISEAQHSGKPETIVVPMIAQAPGYLALDFLNDLKAINISRVTETVGDIEAHLVCVESATLDKGKKMVQVNSSIREWIIKNELCDITSHSEIQARVDALKDYEVSSLNDLKDMEREDFEKCGFRGIKVKKAYTAAQNH